MFLRRFADECKNLTNAIKDLILGGEHDKLFEYKVWEVIDLGMFQRPW